MTTPHPAWRESRPHMAALHAYVPGKQPTGDGWVKLNTNELPYTPSPAVGPAVAAEVSRLAKYPAPTSAPLRAALAARHGLAPAQVIVGNGSDEILSLLMRAFLGPGRVGGQTSPSYSLYPVLAAAEGAELRSLELDRVGRTDFSALADWDLPIFFLTTPNAPFGVGFERSALRAAIAGFKGIFVADEAYADFADESAAEWLAEFPHLVVCRTFSKSYGLAGLRVGYALAAPETIDLLDRIRDSYNVNRLSQAGALAALRDEGYFREVVGKVRSTRERFSADLQALGWEVLPSKANFVFARPPVREGDGAATARSAFEWLEAHRVLVRYFPSSPLTADGLRITIGTGAEMARCLEELTAWQHNA